MGIKEIYENEELVKIETELVELFSPSDSWGYIEGPEKERAEELFLKRKRLLDRMFQMDEKHKKLLSEFNEALKVYLIEMRHKAIDTYDRLREVWPDPTAQIEVEARCYFGYRYPRRHPVRTSLEKRMWAILTMAGLDGGCDDWYENFGVTNIFSYDGEGNEMIDEMEYIYLYEHPENWNDGMDLEMTKDMCLIYAVHCLYDHTNFAMLDFLWAREFTTQINVVVRTGKERDEHRMYEFFDSKA